MVSGYYHERDSQVIIVAINYDVIDQKIKLEAIGFSEGIGVKTFKPYMTTESTNFQPLPVITALEDFVLPARSITTFVGEIDSVNVVQVNSSVTVNKNFELVQNYPNPFNPTTTINYKLPESSYVTLNVYDVLGNEISKLINERQVAGNYNLLYDGSRLSSGTYFLKIHAVGDDGYVFNSVKKIVLIK
jgi:hypothetical protein